jgi:hypothetical protein
VIPLGELVGELLVGLGLALAGANAWVLLRPRFTPPERRKHVPPIPSRRRVYRNIAVGVAVALIGLLSLVGRG